MRVAILRIHAHAWQCCKVGREPCRIALVWFSTYVIVAVGVIGGRPAMSARFFASCLGDAGPYKFPIDGERVDPTCFL